MSTGIEKYKAEVQNLKVRARNLRDHMEDQSAKVQKLAVGNITAYSLGAYMARTTAANQTPFSLLGMDTKLTAGILLYGGSQFVDGRVGEMMEAAGEAALNVYAYEKGHG